MKLSLILRAAATAVVLFATPAISATWNFSGVLTSSSNIDGPPIGTSFSGSADVEDGGVAVSSLVLTLNTSEQLSFNQDGAGTLFNLGGSNSIWGLYAPISGPEIDEKAPVETFLYRNYATDSLGGLAPTFDDFKAAVEAEALLFELGFFEAGPGYLFGKITSIELGGTTPDIPNVPVPLSALMLLTGIVGLGAVRARTI